jgi:hypothetical protein
MSEEYPRKLSVERIALIAVSVLLVIALIYIVVSNLNKDDGETDIRTAAATETMQTVGETPAEQLQPVQTDQPVVVVEVTPTPRRLEVVPTPTEFFLDSLDDPRAVLNLAKPDGYDYFDEVNWFEYDNEDSAAYWLEDGRLYGKDYEPEEKNVYWSFTNYQSGNTFAEVTATNGDCIEKDSVGLVIRVQSDNTPSGYALEVACDGSWRFRRHRGAKSAEEIIDWTPSEFINSGVNASNRIGLWGYMGMFYLYVNRTQVGEYFDRDYPITYGYFAVYTRASRTFDYTTSFDDFAYWHIPYIP